MTFFPEIDREHTIKNAKRKLKEYPKWREIAHDRYNQKITQTFSFELRQPHSQPSRPVEKIAIAKVDAQEELDAIEQAVNQIISPIKRRIIYEKYMKDEPLYDFEIYGNIGYSNARYYEILDEALLSFANAYRRESLLVTKKME